MGRYNPRNSVPNNFSNSGFNKKNNGPMPPMGQQAFVNMPNNFVPMQNNQMGFPMSAPVMFPGQTFPGFIPQFNGMNMNNGAVFPTNGSFRPNMNQVNLAQQAAQFQNMQNFAQLMSQNMGVPNGQMGMQNMNQFYAMQMAALAQMGTFNIPVSNQMLGSMNQGNTGRDSHNPVFSGAPPYGAACSADGRGSQINMAQSSIDQRDLPDTSDNLEWPPGFQPPANEEQALATTQTVQDKHVSNGQSNMLNSWKHSPKNNLPDRSKNGRWENPKFMPSNTGKRKFDGPRDYGNRGGFNGKQRNNNNTSSNQEGSEPKRSIPVSYTAEEIQQWRDQRRKNHPSRANKDELQKEKLNSDEIIKNEEKLRREQLKEVLAKQAELGVEVADIPSHYLMDTEKQEGKINETELNKKERPRNKRNKQGRNKNRNQFTKRQHNTDSANGPPSMNREPTLLQKLLSADIKRDKLHLLQVFRFMVMNNLLKDGEDKPLEYPVTLLKDTNCDVATFKEELSLDASASLPGILKSDAFAAESSDHEIEEVVNFKCAREFISVAEEGEILC